MRRKKLLVFFMAICMVVVAFAGSAYAEPAPTAPPTSEPSPTSEPVPADPPAPDPAPTPTPAPENDPSVSVQAVGCSNSSCTGKDPQANGCGADSYTTKRRYDTVGGAVTLELRYSFACNAYWARLTTNTASSIYRRAYIREYDRNHTYLRGYAKTIGNGASGTFSGWTKMIGYHGARDVRACWRLTYGPGRDPYGSTYCTAFD
ncbi:DUF2690 domain-containing protein [Planobispora siamensis]|uniref:DUF2690 domain-containing protein n=1 Tax=Planobispora siamensis TaxID=936338 RepID=A0A8J3SRU6_9ACTN|nr:DUF2690 domain-containing protein [Planobispora siamensis]GIH97716.1 hypothetical protein Psi01_83460 [Planobispora siamensis]